MPVVRPNSQKAPAKKTVARAPGANPTGQPNSLFFRGDSAFDTADKAIAEAKARSAASGSQNRFYLGLGKSAEIVILDKKIEVGCFEHEVPIPGKKYKRYVPCIGALPGMTCPLCRAGDRKTYRLFASVLDLSEYTNRKGEKITRRKRLLPITQGDKERWQTMQNNIIKKHGTMRGTYMFMSRSQDQRSSRIGEPSDVDGMLYQHMTEQELVSTYGHKAIAENGKIVKPANDDIKPLEYDKIFPYPSEEFIAALESEFGNGIPEAGEYEEDPGGNAVMGSASDVDAAWEEEMETGTDEIPMGDSGEEMQEEGGDAFIGMGAHADAGNEEAAQLLTETAEFYGIDVEALADWASVEAAILEAREPAPPPPPAKKAIAKKAFAPVAKKAAPAPIARKVPAPVAKKAFTPVAKKAAPAPVAKKAISFPAKKAAPGGPVRPNRGAFN